MTRKVVVIGAGIVGSAVAGELSRVDGVDVTVVDRSPAGALQGSTVHAPGFIGLYNDAAILTEFAIRSAEIYDGMGNAFVRAGGLEIATTDSGALDLERRHLAAIAHGLPSRQIDGAEAATRAPGLIAVDNVVAAYAYPRDGTAEASRLTRAIRSGASSRGALFVDAHEVTAVSSSTGGTFTVEAEGRRFIADDVVLAGGIWGPTLADRTGVEVPLFPVAHPYVYSGRQAGLTAGSYVRWPERHVYARVHGNRIGIGTYDHAPVSVAQSEIFSESELPWDPETFDPVISSALGLLPAASHFVPDARLNGVFAMTPDNLPLLGQHPGRPGLWSALAVWVTHAAGAAAALATEMTCGSGLSTELAPDRFSDLASDEQRSRALGLYRDIFSNDST